MECAGQVFPSYRLEQQLMASICPEVFPGKVQVSTFSSLDKRSFEEQFPKCCAAPNDKGFFLGRRRFLITGRISRVRLLRRVRSSPRIAGIPAQSLRALSSQKAVRAAKRQGRRGHSGNFPAIACQAHEHSGRLPNSRLSLLVHYVVKPEFTNSLRLKLKLV